MSFEVSGPDPDESEIEISTANPSQFVFGLIFIRDKSSFYSIWLQVTLLIIGFLGILTTLYFCFVATLVSWHHFRRDPYVYVIPDFVNMANQYSSRRRELNQWDAKVLARYQNVVQKAILRHRKLYLAREHMKRGKPGILF